MEIKKCPGFKNQTPVISHPTTVMGHISETTQKKKKARESKKKLGIPRKSTKNGRYVTTRALCEDAQIIKGEWLDTWKRDYYERGAPDQLTQKRGADYIRESRVDRIELRGWVSRVMI